MNTQIKSAIYVYSNIHPIHVCRSLFDKVYTTSTYQKLSKFWNEPAVWRSQVLWSVRDMKTGARQQKVKDTAHINTAREIKTNKRIPSSVLRMWSKQKCDSEMMREETDDEICYTFHFLLRSLHARSRACWPIYYRIRPKKCLILYWCAHVHNDTADAAREFLFHHQRFLSLCGDFSFSAVFIFMFSFILLSSASSPKSL